MGIILVTVPNGDRIGIHTVVSHKKKFQPADDVLLTFSELNYLFRRAGFRPVRIKGYGGLFPILPRYSRTRQICLRVLSKLLAKHPLYWMRQKQLLFVLRKDDYLLGTDY